MPKAIWKLDKYNGGLNTGQNHRDIAENELSEATDIMVDEVGRIRLMGTSKVHDDSNDIVLGFYGGTAVSGQSITHATATATVGTGGEVEAITITSAGSNYDITKAVPSISVKGGHGYGVSLTPVFMGAPGTGIVSVTINSAGQDYIQYDNAPWDLYQWCEPGYGLFQFKHDWTKGAAFSGTEVDTGDTYTVSVGDESSGGRGYVRIISRHEGWDDTNLGFFKITAGSYSIYAASSGSNSHDDHVAPVFYSVDGAMRISDATFDRGADSAKVMWYGFINRKFYGNGSSGWTSSNGVSKKVWQATEAGLVALEPSNIIGASQMTGTVAYSPMGESGTNDGSNHSKTFLLLDFDGAASDATTGWFLEGDEEYEIGLSTLYDDLKQESTLHVCQHVYYSTNVDGAQFHTDGATLRWELIQTTDSNIEKRKIRINFHVLGGETNSSGPTSKGLHAVHSRVSGFRVYMRKKGEAGNWYLQAELDMTQGSKWLNAGSYNMWDTSATINFNTGGEDYSCPRTYGEYAKGMRQIETYEGLTGIKSSAEYNGFRRKSGSSVGFKTAVVHNRIAYVGNVKIVDEKGTVQTMADAILKSPVNQFDVFSPHRMLESSIKDGDEIVKLEAFADRILEFKRNQLNIINVSQSIDFLEDSFPFKGIKHPASACATDFGVAWANENGLYLYDGQSVKNLLEKRNMRVLDTKEWSDFIYTPMVGFLPLKRQIIIVDDIGKAGKGDCYIYDLVTGSITHGAGKFPDVGKSNFITDENGDLIFTRIGIDGQSPGESWQIDKWDDTSAPSEDLVIKSKEIDFGQYAQRKKIYKVYVTHRNADSGKINLRAELWSADTTSGASGPGEVSHWATFNSFTEDQGNYQGGNWITETFTPPATDEAANAISWSNAYSMRLLLTPVTGQTIPGDLEINDISIVYRGKNIK